MKAAGGFLILLWSTLALADRASDEARQLNERATGAYALGHYSEAADLYEQAFAKKPLPELLYNAAQAHRFAGSKERALQLYENCLRVYADRLAAHRNEIELHITELRFAIAVKSEPRPSPAPQIAKPDKPAIAPTMAPQKAPPPLDLTDDEPEPPKPKKKSRAWIWGVVAGAVAAVGLGIGLGVGLSSTDYPSPSLGSLKAK
jgi:tetratricopeptide (TPR) repeat protein